MRTTRYFTLAPRTNAGLQHAVRLGASAKDCARRRPRSSFPYNHSPRRAGWTCHGGACWRSGLARAARRQRLNARWQGVAPAEGGTPGRKRRKKRRAGRKERRKKRHGGGEATEQQKL